MYNEKQDNFSVKDVVLQILFVILFVFILMWLFPSKQFVKDALEPLYDRIFSENVLIMKDAAKGYYTTPRLPVNVGDKVSMTLGEMLNKKLLIEFKDSSGKTCDRDGSYVQITKYDEEFVMKVNLKCSKQENYILVYMGCYDYCKTTICEKEQTDVKTPVIRPTNPVIKVTNPTQTPGKPTPQPGRPTPEPGKPTPTPEPGKPTPTPEPGKPTPTPEPGKPTPTPDKPKQYICEYLKVTNGSYGPWSEWSNWSKTEVSMTQLRKIQTKTQTETTTGKQLIGYNNITKDDPNRPIYGTKQVKVGTKQVKSCVTYGYTLVPTGEYRKEWVDKGVQKLYHIPQNTSTTRYEDIKKYVETTCGTNCTTNYWTARVYELSSTPVMNQVYGCTQYKTETVDVWGTVNVIIGYEKIVVREPVYKNVTKQERVKYYRYSTRSLLAGSKDYKWSNCNDTGLLDSGYKLTGNKKEK